MKLNNTWKTKSKHIKVLLSLVWVLAVVHFLKDLSQDLLGITTVLDNLGDIKEDISSFPLWLEHLYHWAMVNTVIGEVILVVLIPKYIFRTINILEKRLIIGFLLYIPVMFFIAFLLSL